MPSLVRSAEASGDHGLQIIRFYSFRSDAPRGREYAIVPFDQDEIAEYARPISTFGSPPRSFDDHVSRLVTERVVKMTKNLA